MKVRIQNDGKPGYFTRVTDAETGEELHINLVHLEIDVKSRIPYAQFVSLFSAPAMDIVADASITRICRHCGQLLKEEEEDQDAE